jgi:predicted double-glycine peptidase
MFLEQNLSQLETILLYHEHVFFYKLKTWWFSSTSQTKNLGIIGQWYQLKPMKAKDDVTCYKSKQQGMKANDIRIYYKSKLSKDQE